MATEGQIDDAKLRVDDKVDVLIALTELSDIVAGSGEIQFFIKRDDILFNFSRLKSVLESGNANEDTMISSIESALLTAIGPDEVTASTIRKALRDLVTAHEADIAGT